MSREVRKYQGNTPVALVESNMEKMVEAIPGNREVTVARFKQAAIGVARSKGIAQCEPTSVVKAIYECARLNLIPDPVLHHVAIVPFKNKGRKEATVVVEYRGLIELMKRAVPGLRVWANTVYANDEFTYVEGDQQLFRITKRWWMGGHEQAGEPICHFACAQEPGQDDPILVVIPTQEAIAIGRASKAGMRPGTPWHDHFDRMAEKTCIRRLERFLRMNPENPEVARLQRAMEIDERTDELPSGLGPDIDEAESLEGMEAPEEGEGRTSTEQEPPRRQVKSTSRPKEQPEKAEKAGKAASQPQEPPQEEEATPDAPEAPAAQEASEAHADEGDQDSDDGDIDLPEDTGPPRPADLGRMWSRARGFEDTALGMRAVKKFFLLEYGIESLADADPSICEEIAAAIEGDEVQWELYE